MSRLCYLSASTKASGDDGRRAEEEMPSGSAGGEKNDHKNAEEADIRANTADMKI